MPFLLLAGTRNLVCGKVGTSPERWLGVAKKEAADISDRTALTPRGEHIHFAISRIGNVQHADFGIVAAILDPPISRNDVGPGSPEQTVEFRWETEPWISH